MGSGVSAERREGLETIARELERLAKDVQSLSHELHPPALDEFGLVEALRIECLTFARRTGLSIGFQGHVMPFEPPVEVGLALYRITQEALRNCLEHAGASAVAVSIEGNRGRLRLRVADDGAGFDVARQARRTGLGISGMRERARLAGAAFSIESAPGRGTTVSVTWPDRRGQRLRPGRVDEGPEAPD
jgi:signal transduction histidine kinase